MPPGRHPLGEIVSHQCSEEADEKLNQGPHYIVRFPVAAGDRFDRSLCQEHPGLSILITPAVDGDGVEPSYGSL